MAKLKIGQNVHIKSVPFKEKFGIVTGLENRGRGQKWIVKLSNDEIHLLSARALDIWPRLVVQHRELPHLLQCK